MKCPVCEERMREVEKSGVHLDICPNCKGVWLDRGELEKLMEIGVADATRSEVRSSDHGVARPYDRQDDHAHEHRERDHERHAGDQRGYGERKRKGSWLGDILGGLGGGDD